MIWSLWLTFESDGQTLLAIGSDSRPFGWFPFSRPTWAKVICRSWWWSEESRSRRTFQSRSSSLGPHLGSGQDINVHLYKCFFFTALLYRKLFPNPDHCNHQSFSQASLEITFPKERKKPFLAGKKFTLIITTLTRCAAMKGEVVKLGLKTLSRGKRRRSLSNFKLIRAQTNNLITHKLLSQNGRKFSLFSYF